MSVMFLFQVIVNAHSFVSFIIETKSKYHTLFALHQCYCIVEEECQIGARVKLLIVYFSCKYMSPIRCKSESSFSSSQFFISSLFLFFFIIFINTINSTKLIHPITLMTTFSSTFFFIYFYVKSAH